MGSEKIGLDDFPVKLKTAEITRWKPNIEIQPPCSECESLTEELRQANERLDQLKRAAIDILAPGDPDYWATSDEGRAKYDKLAEAIKAVED